MNEPLINILIRTHRPELLSRCVMSVIHSGYSTVKVHFFPEGEAAWNQAKICSDFLSEIAGIFTVLHFYRNPVNKPYHYNEYCNLFMGFVEEGNFLFLDDDDVLIPGALLEISKHLTEPDQPVICQMLREGRPKPADIYMDKGGVIKGRIGMPCLILHSKWKDAYTFEAVEDADYRWIKEISEILKCKFVKIPVVDAGRRSHGQ